MLSPTNNSRPSHTLRLGFVALLVIWLIAIGLLLVNRQSLKDWWRLRGYNPPAAIVKLANEDTMTSYTRHLFYLNRPQLLPTVTSFRANCPENASTIVLGCYHPDQDGIFIYNVPDPTLAGIQQVTAAHEVLHAVYARLTNSERTTLDAELEDYYKHGLHDSLVQGEITLYQETEPNDVLDEMSCTFGTEIANLPQALESYYQHYFSNRSAIVGYEQQYEAAFSSRQAQINQDDAQLSQMKAQINNLQAQLKVSISALNAQLAALTTLRNSTQLIEYNDGVPAYNDAVDQYNAKVQTLTALISQYNKLVATRNQVAGQLTTLDGAIDTRTTPQPQSTQ